MRNIVSTIYRLGSMTGIALTSAIVTFVLLVAFLTLPLAGSHKILIVLSGSMEPTFSAGSLVLIRPHQADRNISPLGEGVLPRYTIGDVISFNLPKVKQFVTHRIVSLSNAEGTWVYQTKGDANKENDGFTVSETQVLGKVAGSLPYIGKLVGFAKTKQGIAILVLIPALLVLVSEVALLFRRMRSFHVLPLRTEAFFLAGLMFGVVTMVGTTQAFFSDTAASTDNIFQASDIFPGAPGSVVINEIMWMGTQGDAADEWIELRNMTGQTIDLSNWVVDNLGSGGTDNIVIPSGKSISANGFFFIANDTKATGNHDVDPDLIVNVSLQNPGEQLRLRTSDGGTIIDTADNDGGGWFAGVDPGGQNPERSMERNNIPSDGTIAGNWHSATIQTNMDIGARELATPRATNGP